MKRRHRKDANQDEIVEALKKIGCTVEVIGRPVDLLVGIEALNFLFDVKNPETGHGKTPAQRKFFERWKGQVRVIHSAEEACKVVAESYLGAKMARRNYG